MRLRTPTLGRHGALLAPLSVLVLAVLTGCSTMIAGTPSAIEPAQTTREEGLVTEYFQANNQAARTGSAAQERFLDDTQHPDYPRPAYCSLDGFTIEIDPTMQGLRPAPHWPGPTSIGPPRGKVLVVPVRLTVHRSGALVGEQIGSLYVASLDGRLVGFAPCPNL